MTLVEFVYAALSLTGVWFLWRDFIQPRLRSRPSQVVALQTWEIVPARFFDLALMVVIGAVIVPLIVIRAWNQIHEPDTTAAAIVWGIAFQLGILCGIIGFYKVRGPSSGRQSGNGVRRRPQVTAGVRTFLEVLPIVYVTGWLWQSVLKGWGVPVIGQQHFETYFQANSPVMRIAFLVLAAVLAPIGEELVFRAGLFRYLRSRANRALAMLGPAFVFACIHVDIATFEGIAAFVPLLALGLFFSLAYERTGDITVTMIAHSLFNLASLLLASGMGRVVAADS